MRRILVLIVIVSALLSCTEEDVFFPPNVVTKSHENLSGGGAKLTGSFSNFSDNDVLGFQLYSNSLSFIEYVQSPVSGDNSVIIESGLYKNREYFYNTFIQTQDSVYYGLIKSFISNGSKPVVFNSIEPSTGNFNTEVKLTTTSNIKNVSFNDIEVFFNDRKAYITAIEENSIICRVPYYENNHVADIKINYLGDLSPTNLNFTLLKPEITSVTPTEATFNSRIVITGNNFENNGDYLHVYINDIKSTIYRKLETGVEVVLPEELKKNSLDIRVESNLQETLLTNAATLKHPVIYNIPSEISIREDLIIEGSNFYPLGKYTDIFLDDNEHFLLNWVDQTIYPRKIGTTVQNRVYKDWNVKAKVVILETFETNTFDVTITDPIIKIKEDYDEVLTHYHCYFQGINYVFGINHQDNQLVLHQFDKTKDEFFNKKLVTLPLNSINSVLYNDGFIYIRNSAGEENYYRVNMQDFSVEILEDFSGNMQAVPFYIDKNKIIYKYQEAYSSQGVYLFEYNINTNTWTSRKDETTATINKMFFNTEGKTYFLEGIYSAIEDIYVFDGTTFKKSDLELQSGFKDYYSEVIFDDNKFYFIEKNGRGLDTNRIMVLDLSNNQWTEYTDFLFDDISFGNSFKVDNYIYLEGVNQLTYKKELYKLDLNKL